MSAHSFDSNGRPHNESNNSNIFSLSPASSVSSVFDSENRTLYSDNDNVSTASTSETRLSMSHKPTTSRKSPLVTKRSATIDKSPLQAIPPTSLSPAEILGIKPELYKHSAEIDLPPSRIGRVWFKLVYDGAVETLTVEVLKVRQLISREHGNVPRDSFVKLFLLPDERISQQTKVKPRTNNPTFAEKFVFQVSNLEMKKRCLRLSVYDAAKGMRHLIGHALVSLKEVDPSTEEEYLWRDLDDIAHIGDSGSSLGELNIGLSYIPNLNRLNVVIIKARNLRKVDMQSNGIYVKISLSQGHSTMKTKYTTIQDGSLDLHYNESFSFKVPPEDVDRSCLSIMVLTTRNRSAINQAVSSFKSLITKGRYETAHKYGRIAIGSFMYCRGAQLMHWQDAISKSCQICTKWHPLSEVIETL